LKHLNIYALRYNDFLQDAVVGGMCCDSYLKLPVSFSLLSKPGVFF